MRTLLAAEGSTAVSLLIPRVVIDELRRQVVETIDEVRGQAARDMKQFAQPARCQSGVDQFEVSLEDKKAIMARFDRRIRQFSDEGRILEYSSTQAQEIARRSIRTQPPFSNKECGLWDTLLWLSIKEFLINKRAEDTGVILVSQDGDFYGQDGTALHEDLTRELEEADLPRNAVVALRKLQDVIDSYVVEGLGDVDLVREAIIDGAVAGFAGDDWSILEVVNDWTVEWIVRERTSFHGVAGRFAIEGFDLLDSATLQCVTRALDLGNGLVSVGSEWVAKLTIIVDEMRDVEYFGGFPPNPQTASMSFSLLSLLLEEQEGKYFVQSHEVARGSLHIEGATAY